MAVGMGSLGVMGGVALFSRSAGSQGNPFAAGTVVLGSSARNACAVADLAPGDSGTCTDAGLLNAWVALNIRASSVARAACTPQGSRIPAGEASSAVGAIAMP